eukprot:366104-Chlamydomonas_euryale.AAC.9
MPGGSPGLQVAYGASTLVNVGAGSRLGWMTRAVTERQSSRSLMAVGQSLMHQRYGCRLKTLLWLLAYVPLIAAGPDPTAGCWPATP